VRAYAADAKSLDELRKPKFTSKYLINHVSEKLIPAVRPPQCSKEQSRQK
jgi:F-type H+-transporting ATPase subunit alpha